ncbi:hypothetical protein [Streptomyces cyanogenus]|uniref:Uncharacterized protein n=1 Tax=Streptomyces cyanogenus TaxID=80860 RepID=A0ABX7TKE4_STRCY|nr:hypothetical protein [Streptomyces cyanogenus]QTD96063.1 hypothetical protein S1361_01830 [Streptomyces cyanogenus]
MNEYQDEPAHRQSRPERVDAPTVEALGSLSKALETTERARGHLYSFHQLTGGADLELERAVRLLREAGHAEWAAKAEAEILGRDVIPGLWTFQIIEAYNETYYRPFQELERSVVNALAQGRDHLYEAEMRVARRTLVRLDPTARPPAADG